jgi:hypothetical protein
VIQVQERVEHLPSVADWCLRELEELRCIVDRYGESLERDPKRVGKAVSPQGNVGGFGLDLHDCWLLASESHMSLVVLDPESKRLREEQMQGLVEEVDAQNHRQRNWLLTRIKRAAPQAHTVPL